jgi:hypothetical protein
MSEDCHNSDNVSPEEFERWKIGMQNEMLQAANALRSFKQNFPPVDELRSAIKSLRGTNVSKKVVHLGRWEELTVSDFQFLYAIGVSCE